MRKPRNLLLTVLLILALLLPWVILVGDAFLLAADLVDERRAEASGGRSGFRARSADVE